MTILTGDTLNVTPDIIKLLAENIGRTLFDKNSRKTIFDPPSIVVEIKIKTNIWELIKLKSFCKAKDKGNYRQYEKTTLRMGKNNCK